MNAFLWTAFAFFGVHVVLALALVVMSQEGFDTSGGIATALDGGMAAWSAYFLAVN